HPGKRGDHRHDLSLLDLRRNRPAPRPQRDENRFRRRRDPTRENPSASERTPLARKDRSFRSGTELVSREGRDSFRNAVAGRNGKTPLSDLFRGYPSIRPSERHVHPLLHFGNDGPSERSAPQPRKPHERPRRLRESLRGAHSRRERGPSHLSPVLAHHR